MLRIIYAVLFLTLCPCFQDSGFAATEASPSTLSLPKSGLAVGVQLEEYGKLSSRKISIAPMFEPVNPDATLVVSFPPPQDILLLQGYPEWEQLDKLLASLNALVESRKRHTDLMLAVDSGQLQKLSEFEDSSEKYDDQYDALDTQARQVLGAKIYGELDIKTVDLSSTGVRFVDILAEWIKSRREELSRQTAAIVVNAKSSATISIQVFHESEDGATKVLHVDPYDNIPAGNLTSNPKTELGLSASEYAQLSKGYELSNSVAQGIMQFGQNIKTIQDKLHGLADTVNKQLIAFANSFEDKGKLWQQRIEKTDLLIESLTKEPEPVAGKARALQVSLAPIQEDIKNMLATASAIRSLQNQLRGNGLSVALFSQGASIGEDVDTLITHSKKWPEQVKEIQNKITDLTAAVTATEKLETLADFDRLKNDVLVQINKSKEEIEALIPDGFKALLVEARRVTDDTQKNENVYHEMATANCTLIPHNLDALVPGIIKLKPASAKPGDVVKIRVILTNPATLEEKTLEYQLKIRYVGLHMGYSGQLVFVAPIKGLQKNTFQASAAVLGTWKYGVEKPVGFKKLWYRMDPGWGVHVMALNQGSGTTETGLGGSVSLWADLVTLGYGWNVGIKGSPPYYFIGVGLLELLQQFRKITPNGQ